MYACCTEMYVYCIEVCVCVYYIYIYVLQYMCNVYIAYTLRIYFTGPYVH